MFLMLNHHLKYLHNNIPTITVNHLWPTLALRRLILFYLFHLLMIATQNYLSFILYVTNQLSNIRIFEQDVIVIISILQNNKAVGLDNISHMLLICLFVYYLYKNDYSSNLSNYRPVLS